VPYHRVIAANGMLGGYGGKAPQRGRRAGDPAGVALKRALLVAEGLTVTSSRVKQFSSVKWP
jgi:O6-methylguanine-DNA--protein-cysteine methyltransferase